VYESTLANQPLNSTQIYITTHYLDKLQVSPRCVLGFFVPGRLGGHRIHIMLSLTMLLVSFATQIELIRGLVNSTSPQCERIPPDPK
jgi:hypothetical protein